MRTTIVNIKGAFDSMVPGIAKQHEAWVTRTIKELLAEYGTRMRGLANQWGYDAGLWRYVRTWAAYSTNGVGNINEYTGVDAARLSTDSMRYAQDQVDSFVAKLERKFVDLVDVNGLGISGNNFSFNGTLVDGTLREHAVHVEQRTVHKVSSRGTPFQQWPCRIYVDGKFMSEAQFKKLAAPQPLS